MSLGPDYETQPATVAGGRVANFEKMAIGVQVDARELVDLFVNLQAFEKGIKLLGRQVNTMLTEALIESLLVKVDILFWQRFFVIDIQDFLNERVLSRGDSAEVVKCQEASQLERDVAFVAGVGLRPDGLELPVEELLRQRLVVVLKAFELITRH